MRTPARRPPFPSGTAAVIIGVALLNSGCGAGTRGLLASPGHLNQPVKGIYFFPGAAKQDAIGLFTSFSDKPARDNAWNDSGPAGVTARNQIVMEIAALGTDVIFNQYSGAYSDKHFVSNTT